MIKEIIPQYEWKILRAEIFDKDLPSVPFPRPLVKTRELLLLAQSFLAKFEFTKSKEKKIFFGELYRKIMETYFAWGNEIDCN